MPKQLKKILSIDIFNEACCAHDLNYATGGTEKDRKIADDIFLKSMLLECQFLPFIEKKWCTVLAHTYYIAVRRLGKSSYNYK